MEIGIIYRYKLTIEYDGTGFSGWQLQKDTPSIQGIIELAIFNLTKTPTILYVCGRTDAGVHAKAQVAHFNSDKYYDPQVVSNALNFYIKQQDAKISIIQTELVDDTFHARFSAKKRTYQYVILNRNSPSPLYKNRVWHVKKPINITSMTSAASLLLGTHDFSSFRNKDCQAKSPIRTLDRIDISSANEFIYLDFESKSFLHNMVRNITGTLVKIGSGEWPITIITEILEAKDRSKAGPKAPACGLYFMKVQY